MICGRRSIFNCWILVTYTCLFFPSSVPNIQSYARVVANWQRIHETLLHALHSDSSDWPSRIQAHALDLLRNGEATTFPVLLKRVLDDISADQKRMAAGEGVHPLALPKVVIEEGVRVTRESLEQVCEVVGGNN
jgi:hypothetical protein